jgi:hypothetical protein
MTGLKSRLTPDIAAVLLILALFTIQLMRWLYNRRVISYRATRHFFGAARMLERWAQQVKRDMSNC